MKDQHQSTSIYKGYIAYLEKKYGRARTEAILSELPLPLDYIESDTNWVSEDFYEIFSGVLWKLPDIDSDFPYQAGKLAMSKSSLGPVQTLVTRLFSVDYVFEHFPFFSGRLNKVDAATVTQKEKGRIRIQINIRRKHPKIQDAVGNWKGFLEELPVLFGLPPAVVTGSVLGPNAFVLDVKWIPRSLTSSFGHSRVLYFSFACLCFILFSVLVFSRGSGYFELLDLWVPRLALVGISLFLVLSRRFGIFKNFRSNSDQLSVRQLLVEFDERYEELRKKEALVLLSKVERESSESIARMATQIAHDIRSPVGALKVVLANSTTLDPDIRILVHKVMERISEIADSLLAHHAHNNVSSKVALLTHVPVGDLLKFAVIEKQLEYKARTDVQFEVALDPLVTSRVIHVDPAGFRRVLSNLINNAYEAVSGEGRISVAATALENSPHQLCLTIRDSGRGIPKEILSKLGRVGFSYNKVDGSGLGLHHAMSSVESWGGSIHIDSSVDSGTLITISLPLSPSNSA